MNSAQSLFGGGEKPQVGTTSLSDAVWAGDLAAVNAAIRLGANVNAAEGDRQPPLHLAIEQMEVEIVRRLIEAGAAVDGESGWGWSPLAHAVDIESDASWQSGESPEQVSTDLTELLLKAGALPTQQAIDIARRYGNHKALALLLGASPA
jgi:ankyrin repeat protein